MNDKFDPSPLTEIGDNELVWIPEEKPPRRYRSVAEMREMTEGEWHPQKKKCPKCNATLLKNKEGDEWCSLIECDFGIEDTPAMSAPMPEVVLSYEEAQLLRVALRHASSDIWQTLRVSELNLTGTDPTHPDMEPIQMNKPKTVSRAGADESYRVHNEVCAALRLIANKMAPARSNESSPTAGE